MRLRYSKNLLDYLISRGLTINSDDTVDVNGGRVDDSNMTDLWRWIHHLTVMWEVGLSILLKETQILTRSNPIQLSQDNQGFSFKNHFWQEVAH